MLELNIDAYGTKGRASCLADYVEYCCELGEKLPLSKLADNVHDHDWDRLDLDLVDPATTLAQEAPSEFESNEEDVVARVWEILRNRQLCLASRYPFKLIGDGRGAYLERCGKRTVSYIALLATTMAHAYSVEVSGLIMNQVEDSFEEFVADALRTAGISSSVIPTYGLPLKEKIMQVAQPLGLRPQVELASFSTKAKDGGTDIVCHLPTSDERKHACFLILGQVTCGKTNTWAAKAAQINSNAWRKMLQMEWDPMTFLAVPHHVERRLWPLVSQEGEAAIVDRLRLVAMSNSPTEDGLTIARTLFPDSIYS